MIRVMIGIFDNPPLDFLDCAACTYILDRAAKKASVTWNQVVPNVTLWLLLFATDLKGKLIARLRLEARTTPFQITHNFHPEKNPL
jgi:hypothetical protein